MEVDYIGEIIKIIASGLGFICALVLYQTWGYVKLKLTAKQQQIARALFFEAINFAEEEVGPGDGKKKQSIAINHFLKRLFATTREKMSYEDAKVGVIATLPMTPYGKAAKENADTSAATPAV